VKLVGVDFPIVAGSAETRLITTGKIAMVENLRGVGALPRVGFRFSVVPLESTNGGVCAVQAYAEII
jgi:kynurenine formamidase